MVQTATFMTVTVSLRSSAGVELIVTEEAGGAGLQQHLRVLFELLYLNTLGSNQALLKFPFLYVSLSALRRKKAVLPTCWLTSDCQSS